MDRQPPESVANPSNGIETPLLSDQGRAQPGRARSSTSHDRTPVIWKATDPDVAEYLRGAPKSDRLKAKKNGTRYVIDFTALPVGPTPEVIGLGVRLVQVEGEAWARADPRDVWTGGESVLGNPGDPHFRAVHLDRDGDAYLLKLVRRHPARQRAFKTGCGLPRPIAGRCSFGWPVPVGNRRAKVPYCDDGVPTAEMVLAVKSGSAFMQAIEALAKAVASFGSSLVEIPAEPLLRGMVDLGEGKVVPSNVTLARSRRALLARRSWSFEQGHLVGRRVR